MGDLNAKHKLWSRGVGNTRGNVLFSHMMSRDYNILASPTPTLVHYRDDLSPSTPDLLLTKNIYDIGDLKCVPSLSSNHLPTYFKINKPIDRKITRRYNYAKADWAGYKSYLNDSIFLSSQTFKSRKVIDNIVNSLTSCMLSANDIFVPLVSTNKNPSTLPRKVKRLIKFKNRLRRYDQKETNCLSHKIIRNQINFVDKNINQGIKDHNDKLWQKSFSRFTIQVQTSGG